MCIIWFEFGSQFCLDSRIISLTIFRVFGMRHLFISRYYATSYVRCVFLNFQNVFMLTKLFSYQQKIYSFNRYCRTNAVSFDCMQFITEKDGTYMKFYRWFKSVQFFKTKSKTNFGFSHTLLAELPKQLWVTAHSVIKLQTHQQPLWCCRPCNVHKMLAQSQRCQVMTYLHQECSSQFSPSSW